MFLLQVGEIKQSLSVLSQTLSKGAGKGRRSREGRGLRQLLCGLSGRSKSLEEVFPERERLKRSTSEPLLELIEENEEEGSEVGGEDGYIEEAETIDNVINDEDRTVEQGDKGKQLEQNDKELKKSSLNDPLIKPSEEMEEGEQFHDETATKDQMEDEIFGERTDVVVVSQEYSEERKEKEVEIGQKDEQLPTSTLQSIKDGLEEPPEVMQCIDENEHSVHNWTPFNIKIEEDVTFIMEDNAKTEGEMFTEESKKVLIEKKQLGNHDDQTSDYISTELNRVNDFIVEDCSENDTSGDEKEEEDKNIICKNNLNKYPSSSDEDEETAIRPILKKRNRLSLSESGSQTEITALEEHRASRHQVIEIWVSSSSATCLSSAATSWTSSF